MSFKSQRSKACDFSKETKIDMLRRDGYRCILCRASEGLTPAHYIARSSGGLGILENGACICIECHQSLDHSTSRQKLLEKFKAYLDKHYPDFTDKERIFNRRTWLD